MDVVGPILIGIVYICACSFFKEPNKRNFVAIMIGGAGAAYLNGGLGIWEFAFTAVVIYCAYKGLHSNHFIDRYRRWSITRFDRTLRINQQSLGQVQYTPYADVEGLDRFALSRLLPQHATLSSPFQDLRAVTGRDKLGAYKNSLYSWLSEIALLHTTDTAHDGQNHLV